MVSVYMNRRFHDCRHSCATHTHTHTHTPAVGDNILMNGEIHRIKKITLLYTEMITLNGER